MLIERIKRAALAAALILLGYRGDAGLVTANLFTDIYDADTGALVGQQATHNLVVDAGLDLLCSFLNAAAPAGITHFAIGTASTAVVAGQTTLGTELLRDTVSERITASRTITVKYHLTSTSGNGSTLAEVGLFNASSGGSMFARALLTPTIAKTSSIAVTFTWQITFAAA